MLASQVAVTESERQFLWCETVSKFYTVPLAGGYIKLDEKINERDIN